MSRTERLIQLLDAMLVRDGYGATALELSRAVGLKRTPYFMSLLETLQSTGVVSVHHGHYTNGLPVRRFYVPQEMVNDAYIYIAGWERDIQESEWNQNA